MSIIHKIYEIESKGTKNLLFHIEVYISNEFPDKYDHTDVSFDLNDEDKLCIGLREGMKVIRIIPKRTFWRRADNEITISNGYEHISAKINYIQVMERPEDDV